jgi:hypothetical protein
MAQKPGENPEQQTTSRLYVEFSSFVAPVIGRKATEDLFYRTLDHLLEKDRDIHAPQKLSAMAAFFTGEFKDTQPLDKEDLENIRHTFEEVSGEINLDTLTTLMGELLAGGNL